MFSVLSEPTENKPACHKYLSDLNVSLHEFLGDVGGYTLRTVPVKQNDSFFDYWSGCLSIFDEPVLHSSGGLEQLNLY